MLKQLTKQPICATPWNTLGIRNDYAATCCYHTTDFLPKGVVAFSNDDKEQGNWLWDIWNAPAMQDLRRACIDQDLYEMCGWSLDPTKNSATCSSLCRMSNFPFYLLEDADDITRLNYEQYLKSFANHELVVSHYPLAMSLLIGFKCNLKCPTCVQSPSYEQFKEYAIDLSWRRDSLLDFMRHTSELNLIGGEPTIIPIYDEIIALGYQVNRKIFSITSNATHNIDKIIPHISLFRGLVLSIDGCSQETYEVQRYGSKWSNLLKNMEALKDAKANSKFSTTISFVITKVNCHEVVDFVRFAKDYGADRVVYWEVRENEPFNPFSSIDTRDTLLKDLRRAQELALANGMTVRISTKAINE